MRYVSQKWFQLLTTQVLMTLKKKLVESIVGIGDSNSKLHFLLFQQCFLRFWTQSWLFNPFPNKPVFLCVCSTSFLKALWKKEKFSLTERYLLFRSVFNPFGDLSAIFIKIQNCRLQIFSSHEHIVLRVSYCDRSLSGVRPSVCLSVRP